MFQLTTWRELWVNKKQENLCFNKKDTLVSARDGCSSVGLERIWRSRPFVELTEDQPQSRDVYQSGESQWLLVRGCSRYSFNCLVLLNWFVFYVWANSLLGNMILFFTWFMDSKQSPIVQPLGSRILVPIFTTKWVGSRPLQNTKLLHSV